MARTVLAAVEDLLFRSKISETASSLGIEAGFPRNPRRLLEAIHESPPDLLILDLNSARFEPLTLLRSVRSDEATRDVPTVGFLSHVQKDLAVAAREAGCDRVIAAALLRRIFRLGNGWSGYLQLQIVIVDPDRHVHFSIELLPLYH